MNRGNFSTHEVAQIRLAPPSIRFLRPGASTSPCSKAGIESRQSHQAIIMVYLYMFALFRFAAAHISEAAPWNNHPHRPCTRAPLVGVGWAHQSRRRNQMPRQEASILTWPSWPSQTPLDTAAVGSCRGGTAAPLHRDAK